MKRPPVEFEERLQRMFDGRVRIRWSNKRGEWHIEVKVGRARMVNAYVDSYDDPAIRARDGYQFFMAVREGDRMPCPACGYTVKVPLFEVAETVCEYCKLQGKDGRYPAVFFPLEGDHLIQHLCRMDPVRGWRDKLHLKADEANERRLKEMERKAMNEVEAATLENFNRLVGIPQFGYTGKEFKGEASDAK